MVKMSITYVGQKHCELTHGPSGSKIETDAPKDNQGLGEKFSPTDLVGAALGSCILTTMAINAEKEGLSIVGAKCQVGKEMITQPRKIGTLSVSITLPAKLKPEDRVKMEKIAASCPVTQSLHPDLKIPMSFIYE